MSTAATWLVTGASRGLCLELTRQLVAMPDTVVIATVRNPSVVSKLGLLKPTESSELHIVPLDAASEASMRASVGKVEEILKDRGFDYLCNNAGICANDDAFSFAYSDLVSALQTNVASPVLLAQLYLPLLEKGTKKMIVNVSSDFGSFSRDTGAMATTYCISKAALNMLTYKQARSRPDIIAVALNPGWVKTDMGGSNAMLNPQESVAGQLEVVLGLRKEDSGKFFNHEGKEIPW